MKTSTLPPIERHPLSPFLPPNAQLLMLGSFPPQERRWSIRFFYPNFINDMWRIFGICFFDDKLKFVDNTKQVFKETELRTFLSEKGIALYDTAISVRRLSGNASDKDLEIVEQTDIATLLQQIPDCKAIVTTGKKATELLSKYFCVKAPKMGECVPIYLDKRPLLLFSMPSSSRAYPMKLEQKALFYTSMFKQIELLE